MINAITIRIHVLCLFIAKAGKYVLCYIFTRFL